MARESQAARSARVRRLIPVLERLHPDARQALEFRSPFELLIALILAAQCTDERVNRLTPSLFGKYPTPADLARARREELEADIRPTGFFRSKAKALEGCCRALVERHGGEVPARLDDLLALPGVGRKTANIVLGNAFGQPAIGVDTHVMRLAQRLGLSRHSDPDRIEADLTAVVPRRHWVRFCHLLQFHGRRVCLARKPRCPECALARLCPYPHKTAPGPEERGAPAPRPVWVRPGRARGTRADARAAAGRRRRPPRPG
jgi:endonuclease-3